MEMQDLHLQILYLQIRKGKGQSAKDAAKDLNGGLRMGATEDQGEPVGVSWLAIYASEHAKARPRKALLAALKANRGATSAGRKRRRLAANRGLTSCHSRGRAEVWPPAGKSAARIAA